VAADARHVVHDPLFNDICDLLVIELQRHRVAIAEKSDVREPDGRSVAAQTD
jgi:hypothetical protein